LFFARARYIEATKTTGMIIAQKPKKRRKKLKTLNSSSINLQESMFCQFYLRLVNIS